MRDFFFRVASLTFEANVLAELEKSGSRRIGEVVRKYSRILFNPLEFDCFMKGHFMFKISFPFDKRSKGHCNNMQ